MVENTIQQQYENIHVRATDAIEHWDAAPAWNIYRELEALLEKIPAEQKQEPEFAKEVSTLRRGLLVVGFPALPTEEAVRLYREHILDFFRFDVDFRERLLTRYIFVGYGEKDEERLKLKEAVSQNEEKLGSLTVGAWTKLFDDRFRPEKRKENSAAAFFTQAGEVATLQKIEQSILRQIISVYEECLSRRVLDDFDMAARENSANRGQSPVQAGSFSSGSSQKETASLPLLQALSKYENLGNQLITQERIRVKSQPEPVRPSLLYWLKYYRDELGIGQHSSVERGDFLFRSENGRKLSAPERERVNLILKSVEENFPLSIDTEHQEIVFPVFQDVVVPARNDSLGSRSDSGGPNRVARPVVQNNIEEPTQKESAPTLPPVSTSPKSDSFSAKIQYGESFPRPLPSMQPTKPVSAFLPGAKTIGTTAFIEPKPEENGFQEEESEGAPLTTDFSRPYENTGLRMSHGTSFSVEPRQTQEAASPQQAAGGISFSTAHVLPAEREAAEKRVRLEDSPKQAAVPKKEAPSAPMPPRAKPQPMNAFHIRPVSLGGKDQ